MRHTLRALAALLGYPSAELQQHIGEVRAALRAEALVPAAVQQRLEPLLEAFEEQDLLDLQVTYCELFDSRRSLSLHLFEHVHGDGRERGQAMIDLRQQYLDHGCILTAAETPDYLPLFLEFLSCLPEAQARDWLEQPAHVLAALEQRLRERDSYYAQVFEALLALPRAKPDPVAVAELQQRAEREATRSIDDDWEEAPVDFGAPVAQAGAGLHPTTRAAMIATSRDC